MSNKNIINSIHVSSEVGTLKRLLVHSPDSGLGKVVPSKAQDWLFEDIVHLGNMRKQEYDFYTKLLLYFLDPEKVRGKLKKIDSTESNRNFYKPDNIEFHNSDKVVELQLLLSQILEDKLVKTKLVVSICAVEGCTIDTEEELMNISEGNLAKTLIYRF